MAKHPTPHVLSFFFILLCLVVCCGVDGRSGSKATEPGDGGGPVVLGGAQARDPVESQPGAVSMEMVTVDVLGNLQPAGQPVAPAPAAAGNATPTATQEQISPRVFLRQPPGAASNASVETGTVDARREEPRPVAPAPAGNATAN